MTEAEEHLVEAVRQACIAAVLDGHQQSAISGLCHEGAFEAAVDAMRMLDLAAVVQQAAQAQVWPGPSGD